MQIQNPGVTSQIVDYIRLQIESGAWSVGERIPSEPQLVKELGVSRASVRSALQYFIGLGVLRSHQGKGTFLVDDALDDDAAQGKITAEDCRDICKVLEFRQMLEPNVCRMAVQRAGRDVIEALEICLDSMRQSHDTGNSPAFVQADLQFHETICHASENPLAIKSLCRVFQENLRNHEQMNELFGDDSGIRYHTAILNAFRAGDADGAAKLMSEHLLEALDRLRNMMKHRQREQ